MKKMTQEHREFLTGLNSKTEVQVEHVAGCERCFNYFLFGTGYRCSDYPAKHRIKNADFIAVLNACRGVTPKEITASAVALLRARFHDETLAEDTLHEVTIVPDAEWVAPCDDEFCECHGGPDEHEEKEK